MNSNIRVSELPSSKESGFHYCGCDRRISVNKNKCASCEGLVNNPKRGEMKPYDVQSSNEPTFREKQRARRLAKLSPIID
jgi:hypothetical protein